MKGNKWAPIIKKYGVWFVPLTKIPFVPYESLRSRFLTFKNKSLFVVPCHRVVRSDGVVGQYALGTDKKVDILIKEGVAVSNGKVKDLEKFIHKFSTQQAV